jgi:hypothetical protein
MLGELLGNVQEQALGAGMTKQQGSWMSLVAFCAVAVLVAALGAAVLFAGASVTFAVAGPAPAEGANFSGQQSATAASPSAYVAPSAETQPIDDSDSAPSRTFAGMITDSRCGARHPMNSGKSPAECVRSCVRNGAQYVLVDGERIYVLEGDPARLQQLAGQRVNVVGMLEDDTIKVKAVTQE